MLQSITHDVSSIVVAAPSERPDAAPYLDFWINTQALPCLIVMPDLTLIWANEAARQLLDERDDLHLAGDSLNLGDGKRTEAFRAFLALVDIRATAFVHRRRMEESYFIIRAQGLSVPGHPLAIVMSLQSSTASDRYVWGDFGPVFALTRSEVVVVKQLVSGNGAEQIALALCVSVETVRTHIKRVYAKVGVSNREQLFQAVLPFRLG